MKQLFFSAILLIGGLTLAGQTDKGDLFKSRESDQSKYQNVTATLKTSTRLFRIREDLTSVIEIIPSGSVVSVLGADSTYLHVVFDENEGYIFSKHAIIDKTPDKVRSVQQATEAQQSQDQPDSRYVYLEDKYGSSMAARIYAGKIWKGMNSDMVKDSWGTAEKINRVINDNTIKEEWTYRGTWLYFENNILLEWGAVKKE